MSAAVLNLVDDNRPVVGDPVGTVPLAGDASAGMPVPAEAISPNDVVSAAAEHREDVQLVRIVESAATGSPAADTTPAELTAAIASAMTLFGRCRVSSFADVPQFSNGRWVEAA